MKIKTLVVGLGKIGIGYDLNKKNKESLSHCSSVINSKKLININLFSYDF